MVTIDRYMRWVDVGLLWGMMVQTVVDMSPATGISPGFGEMYLRLYMQLEANGVIMEDKRVVSVIQRPTTSGKASIGFDDRTVSIEYDHVVLACDFTKLDDYPLKSILSINRATDVDVTWFGSWLFSTSVELDLSNPIRMLRHVTTLNTTDLINQPLSIGWHGTSGGRYYYLSVFYCEKRDEASLCPIDNTFLLIKEYHGCHGIDAYDVRTEFIRTNEYNVRPSQNLVGRSFHYKLKRSQGTRGVWYTGGFCSHWDVDSIYGHTEELCRNILNHLEP